MQSEQEKYYDSIVSLSLSLFLSARDFMYANFRCSSRRRRNKNVSFSLVKKGWLLLFSSFFPTLTWRGGKREKKKADIYGKYDRGERGGKRYYFGEIMRV